MHSEISPPFFSAELFASAEGGEFGERKEDRDSNFAPYTFSVGVIWAGELEGVSVGSGIFLFKWPAFPCDCRRREIG